MAPHHSIAHRIAGGRSAFSRLPRGERLAILARAKELHALGDEVASAAKRSAARVLEGFVYVIKNDAFPDRVKIGSAVNAESRLADAQTWDPDRSFYIAHTVFVPDRNAAERRIHRRLHAWRLSGEWFAVPLAQARDALNAELR
jgi:hypothetical protein